MRNLEVGVIVAELVNQSTHQPQSMQDEDVSQPHHFKMKEEGQEGTLMQHPKRPNLSSLQVPVRSLENTLSSFARIDIPSPSSARNGLPPRPSSAKFMSSMKNLLPQKSSKGKNLSHDGEKTVLIVPDTPPSDKPSNRPSTSRSFSLNKILFSSSTTSTHSLPVTPMTDACTYEVEE
ncbi:uncharacterized protein LOC113770325, partial [Coffea eugenioides]|uniref:uncharacterized protein LOC113770325 n=1 Tax=Coffea eugenioides TaxID=49369 RepID=UPI000F607AAF